MKLKGNYDAETTYEVGDVVQYTDGVVYNLLHPCPAGTPPVNTLYWGRASAMRAMCAKMIIDMIGDVNTKISDISAKVPTNISDDAILLKSSTASSTKEFIITVDDDGELTATEDEGTEGSGT